VTDVRGIGPPRRIGLPWRLAAVTALFWPAFALYFVIALYPAAAPVRVTMPAWVPFRPEFALPYIGLLFASWLLPAAIRDPGRFVACLRAVVYAYLPVPLCWVLLPTQIDRPPEPTAWWAAPYVWIADADPPRNVLPCAHGIVPVAAAWFLWSDRPAWRWPLAAMLAVGLPSIALVGQHRPADILLGTAFTAIGIAVAEALRRRASIKRESPPVATGGL
jgi:hypothetical protein